LSEPGQYQGKRLSATEVTRLYAAGERDFRGAVLRGCLFLGVDLSDADFSGADIRSAVFSCSKLRKANFSKATAGIGKRLKLIQVIVVFWIATFSLTIANIIRDNYLKEYTLIEKLAQEIDNVKLITSISLILTSFIFIQKGFGAKVSIIFSITSFAASQFLIEFLGPDVALGNLFMFGFFLVIFIGAPSFVVPRGLTLGIIGASVTLPTFASIQTIGLFFAYSLYLGGKHENLFVGLGDAWGFAAFVLIISIYAMLIYLEEEFLFLLRIMRAFSSSFGTKFQATDLSEANFSFASLGDVNFSKISHHETNLFQARFHGAKGLVYAQLENTSLFDSRVLNLITTLNGIDQDLANADLRGANLAGAKLHRANLTGANLSGATLQNAELQGAILTEANCISTDFTAAHLTGACLEAWNYDETTVLQDIDCDYVFLKAQPNARGWREQLPHNPDKCFEPGDFEKYFRDVLDEVRLLIRGGVDPQAFKTAFQALMENHNITPGDVRSIARRDGDVLIDVAIPAGAAKPDVARTFDSAYETALPASTAQALLEAERRSKQDLIQLANKSIDSISSVLSNLTINTTAMNHSQNPNVSTGDGSFYAGGDVNLSGSTLNLGQISGQVTNQINQIPAPAAPGQPDLRAILTQLQTAAETDGELSDDEKAEALQAVSRIATAATAPNTDDKTKGMVKRATTTLKGMTETLTDASKLAEACQKLLPLVLSLFALI
jgi:uncharacterized protein YjbI with pentapeptide repeats